MSGYVTLRERKDAKVAAIKAGAAELAAVLAAYAREHGGRYILFGSAARGDARYSSDVDVLVDFPIEKELEAWLFAERQCFDRNLVPDIHIRAWRTDQFVSRVEKEGRELR